MKRYAPFIVLLVALVAGVYVVGPERLTGQAAIHSDLDTLGPIDSKLFTPLDNIAQLKAIPLRTNPKFDRTDLFEAISAGGEGSLATTVSHFRDNGCVQPGSANLVELIGHMASRTQLDALQRQKIAEILLDAATHSLPELKGPDLGQPAFAERPEVAALVATAKNGGPIDYNIPIPGFDPAIATRSCVRLAIRTAQVLAIEGLADVGKIHGMAMKGIDAVPAGSFVLNELVGLAVETAPEASGAAPLMELGAKPNLSVSLKQRVCRATVLRKGLAAEIKARFGVEEKSLRSCLVEAGDGPSLQAALSSPDLDLRVRAVTKYQLDNDPKMVREALERVYAAGTPEAPMGQREQRVWAQKIAAVVDAVDNPHELLAPIDELTQQHPNQTMVTRALIESFSRKHPGMVKLVDAPNGPKLSENLAALVRGDRVEIPKTFVAPPAGTVGGDTPTANPTPNLEVANGVPAGAEPQAGPGGEMVARPTHGLTVRQSCDVVVSPGPAQDRITEALRAGEENVFVCFRPGVYTGNIVVNKPGVKLVSLEPKGASIDGSVILEKQATLSGFEVKGPVLVARQALGTQIVSNRLSASGISLCGDIIVAGNEQPSDKTFEVDGGRVDTRWYLPPSYQFMPSKFRGKGKALLNKDEG